MKMSRTLLLASAGVFSLGVTLGACTGDSDPNSTTVDEALVAALNACHLNDGTVDHTAEIRACTPAEETHKTTICHIPPGNPSNAHTLCVGTQAVPAHLDHGDSLGSCKSEQPCPPPSTTGAAGSSGAQTGGASGAGTGGSSGGATGGTSGGVGGSLMIG